MWALHDITSQFDITNICHAVLLWQQLNYCHTTEKYCEVSSKTTFSQLLLVTTLQTMPRCSVMEPCFHIWFDCLAETQFRFHPAPPQVSFHIIWFGFKLWCICVIDVPTWVLAAAVYHCLLRGRRRQKCFLFM